MNTFVCVPCLIANNNAKDFMAFFLFCARTDNTATRKDLCMWRQVGQVINRVLVVKPCRAKRQS